MRVLIACEFSGTVRDAFIKRGHDAVSCDLLPTEKPGPHIQGDVLAVLDDGWDLMIAHPPCTYLTVAGNKWFRPEYASRFPDRATQREEAAKFFVLLANAPIEKVCIENPIGVMSSRYRKPDQIIQPTHFGHAVRKATALWLRSLPALKHVTNMEAEIDRFPSGNTQSRWHTETGHIKDASERSKARSRTFPGIANAMAEQWG